MSETGEELLDLALGGVILIVLGSALAPLLPFNVAAIGWLMILGALVAAVVTVVAVISKAVGSI